MRELLNAGLLLNVNTVAGFGLKRLIRWSLAQQRRNWTGVKRREGHWITMSLPLLIKPFSPHGGTKVN